MKELDGTTEPIARMNVEWKLEKAEFAEFNMPTCDKTAVCQLCRERPPSLCGRVMMSVQWLFQMKELDGTTEPISRMNVEWKLEKAEYAEFNLPTCGNIAVWQLCRERQPLWKSHDGLNLTCLDQCHGVRSLGTSSSPGWRKIIVIRHSKNDPWVYIRVFNQPALCRFA